MSGTFKLGVVTVEVTMSDGRTVIEDWNPRHARQAEDYAAETAGCRDVVMTVFVDNRTRTNRRVEHPGAAQGLISIPSQGTEP